MSLKQVSILAALLVVTVVGIVSARQVAIGRAEIAMADAASAKSDWGAAIAHARAAAEALVPGSPWPERGWLRLAAIGHDAEARGDDETALLAYGAMRAAAMGVKGPGSGWQRRRDQADEGLTRVATSRRDPTGPKVTAESMLDALHSEETPATWVLAALAASAVAMLGGLARLAWLGEEASRARVAQGVAALGFVAYAVVSFVN
jgi:hypothetical protein